MAQLLASVEVPGPVEAVWDRLTDPAEQSRWLPATRVRAARGDGRAPGDRLDSRTGYGPLGFTDVMVVAGYQPPLRWQVRHTGRLVRGTGVFELEPLGPARCRVLWSEFLTPPEGLGLPGELALRLARRPLQAYQRWCLRRLAARLG